MAIDIKPNTIIGNFVCPVVWTDAINQYVFQGARALYSCGRINDTLNDADAGSIYNIPYMSSSGGLNSSVDFSNAARSMGSISRNGLTCSVDFQENAKLINLADAKRAGYASYFDDVLKAFAAEYAQGLEAQIMATLLADSSIAYANVPAGGKFDATFLLTQKSAYFGQRSSTVRSVVCSAKQWSELALSNQISNNPSHMQAEIISNGTFQGSILGMDFYVSDQCMQADGSQVAFMMTGGHIPPFIVSTKSSESIETFNNVRANSLEIYHRPLIGIKSLNAVFQLAGSQKPDTRILKLTTPKPV